MRGEKQKILEGKTALFQKFAEKQIEFYIGFPFDPTSEEDTAYDKGRFLGSIINMTKYFDPNETLVASELWDLLSGHTGRWLPLPLDPHLPFSQVPGMIRVPIELATDHF